MSNWKPFLVSAFADLSKGDHASFLGTHRPILLSDLDHALNRIKYSESIEDQYYFLAKKDGIKFFGEFGFLPNRLGDDFLYAFDGNSKKGRPIKYFYGFSSSSSELMPDFNEIKKNNAWMREQIYSSMIAANEFDHESQEAWNELRRMGKIFPGVESKAYEKNFWDRFAQEINLGSRKEGIFVYNLEKSVPGISNDMPIFITEKNWQAHQSDKHVKVVLGSSDERGRPRRSSRQSKNPRYQKGSYEQMVENFLNFFSHFGGNNRY